MHNEEEKRCPLCAEEMDWTDQQLNPCKCGYEVCVWCWHHIMDMAEKDATEGRCPACRTPYDKNRIVGLEANFQRVVANGSSRKQKLAKAKTKPNEGRKDLSNVRVIQRKMAYIIGLPLDLADEELLHQDDYFGQYGKVTKVSLSRTAGGAIQQYMNDTCSVYITYSKEEEAVRCIQSVHGYVLDGRLLKASFGTAKYCHAFLRNMPCNNPACLYLHTLGAEEDSFGKDEVAAVHTRNRVQEIVGGTQYPHRRRGSMLPPPVDEQLNNYDAEEEEPSDLKDVAHAAVASGDHLSCSKEKEEAVRSSKQMTTFVDIVGRSASNKDDEEGLLNLCGDVNIGSSDSSKSNLYSEPFREASDSNLDDTKQLSGVMLGSEGQYNTTGEDSPTSFDEQRWKDPVIASFVSSYPAKTTKDHSDRNQISSTGKYGYVNKTTKDHSDCNQISSTGCYRHVDVDVDRKTTKDHCDCNHISSTGCYRHVDLDRKTTKDHSDCNQISSTGCYRRVDRDRIPSPVSTDGYNEGKFQNSAKSDTIYRSSNSFSTEEIIEHLRRFDDDTLVPDESADLESRIISNILSMNLDDCDYDLSFPSSVTGLFEARQNNDHSRFSFANRHGKDLGSPSNIGQEFDFSGIEDIIDCDIKEYLYQSQHHASRALQSTPPGFSMPTKPPPPGFPAAGLRTELGSGRYTRVAHHYRTPSLGNLSNSSDEVVDPVIMKSSTNDSWTSSFSSTSFDDDTKHWLLLQHQSAPPFSQPSIMQQRQFQYPPDEEDDDNFCRHPTSRPVAHHHQSYNPLLITHHQPPEGFQHVPGNEAARGFGYNSFLPPAFGGYNFQMPTSGELYTRVFGM